ncbi:DUF5666 domain-containing protein [Candidatus Microgenomates bacterium]|nr:DUF5666 domain-containing protein [Candidatus Microgenomates bacterium]
MKKIINIIAIIIFGTLLFIPAVQAAKTPTSSVENSSPTALLKKAAIPKESAVIKEGTLTTKKGNVLTVTKDDKTYTVTIDNRTQLRRKFWGRATLSEIQEKDTVNIIGKWTNAETTKITAKLVRDLSIQKRYGVFFGQVKSTTATGLVMETINRGSQTVTYSSTTRFINRKNQIIKKDQIKEGDKVRIKGLWNSQTNTITEIVQVKDFSLPITPSPTLTPTPKK